VEEEPGQLESASQVLSREPDEDDLEIARERLRTRGFEELAAALVKQRRAELSAPEELPLAARGAWGCVRPRRRRSGRRRVLRCGLLGGSSQRGSALRERPTLTLNQTVSPTGACASAFFSRVGSGS
jgi:hypothetical protein